MRNGSDANVLGRPRRRSRVSLPREAGHSGGGDDCRDVRGAAAGGAEPPQASQQDSSRNHRGRHILASPIRLLLNATSRVFSLTFMQRSRACYHYRYNIIIILTRNNSQRRTRNSCFHSNNDR